MEKPNYRLGRTESANVASILAGINLRKNNSRALDRTFLGGCRCESDGYKCDCEPDTRCRCERDCGCDDHCSKHCRCHSDCSCDKEDPCPSHNPGSARSGQCDYNPDSSCEVN